MLTFIIILMLFAGLSFRDHNSGLTILGILSAIGVGALFLLVLICKLIGSFLSFLFAPRCWGGRRMHRRMRHLYRHMYW